MKMVHLQGIGRRFAVPAKELMAGDVIIYNYGYTGVITEIIPSKTGKTYSYTVVEDGEAYHHKTTAERLFAVKRLNA